MEEGPSSKELEQEAVQESVLTMENLAKHTGVRVTELERDIDDASVSSCTLSVPGGAPTTVVGSAHSMAETAVGRILPRRRKLTLN